MKRFIFVTVFLFMLSTGFTQHIIEGEYYWDNDPGEGKGIALVAFDGNFNTALERVFKANASLPSVGNHVLGVRVKGNDGNWGAVFKRVFKVSTASSNLSLSVQQAEFYWDTDPGEGLGTPLLALDGNFNEALEDVFVNNTALPSAGDHVFGIRIMDNDGNWGTVFKRVFRIESTLTTLSTQIQEAEYFWDTDPGVGSGVTMLAFDGNFNTALETVLSNNVALPSIGDHVFNVRVKGNDGNWGSVYKRVFRVSTSLGNLYSKVIQAEYFWDTDPGEGSGITMLAFDGNFNSALEQITKQNASLPSQGNHVLGIRVRGNSGEWGSVYKRVFRVDSVITSTSTYLTQAEYFWDNDPGEGAGQTLLAFDGFFNSTIEELSQTTTVSLSNGLHTFNIRTKDNTGNWGKVYSKVVGVDIAYNEQVLLNYPLGNATGVSVIDTLKWHLVTGASSYEYIISTDSLFSTILSTGIVNDTIHALTGLSSNTKYYWKVRVNMSGNVSLWSDVWSFTTGTTTDVNLINRDGISIYPNPSNGVYVIESNNEIIHNVNVYDGYGKLVYNLKLNSRKTKIDITDKPVGIYFIRIGEYKKRIVKM